MIRPARLLEIAEPPSHEWSRKTVSALKHHTRTKWAQALEKEVGPVDRGRRLRCEFQINCKSSSNRH